MLFYSSEHYHNTTGLRLFVNKLVNHILTQKGCNKHFSARDDKVYGYKNSAKI